MIIIILLLVALAAAAALADVVIELHNRALGLSQKIKAYDKAFRALTEGDPLKIARAAGGVDHDLRTLMVVAAADTAYYHQVARSAAERASSAETWLVEYQNLRNDLISQLTGITVRLQQIRAHGDMAMAAQPLLRAEKNLVRAHDVLKLGQHGSPSLRIAGLTTRYLE